MNTEKLKLFFQGRKGLLPRIEAACSGQRDILWFHVASYGEFEEARPVIEATRARFPERKILLTVFSPTVFVPMQHYRSVDWVFYLPLDTPRQVRRFLDAVRPAKAIFTITDFWPVLLNALRRRKVDTYIMSVRIEPDSHHLKWHSFLFRQIIRNCYKCVMVQNEESRRLLEGIGVPSVKLTGDPRIDRVLAISGEAWSDPVTEAWSAGQKVFVAGSTYGVEDRMVLTVAAAHPEGKFLLIPHEPEDAAVAAILAQAPNGAVRYTDYAGKVADDALRDAQILVVDTVGLLSRLYAQQLSKRGQKELLDQNRVYYRLLKKLIRIGQEHGEITTDKSLNEIMRLYALAERALLYDWCLREGEYSLAEYSRVVMPLFLSDIRREKNKAKSYLSQY